LHAGSLWERGIAGASFSASYGGLRGLERTELSSDSVTC